MDNNREYQKNNIIGYLALAIFVLIAYISIIGQYIIFNDTVVPGGDPFTYTVGFFNLLDIAHNNYLASIYRAFQANWYWLLNLSIAFLSPILIKAPFSLSIVNFIMYFVATASFFRMARYFKFDMGNAYVFALILWIFPVNYGFLTYSSIPVLGLDAMFIAILYVALANIFVYMLDPGNTKNALIAGVSVGLAIWGRGSSIPVVAMVTFIPFLLILYTIWNQRTYILVKNIIVFSIVVVVFLSFFYFMMGAHLATYYTDHANFIARHTWNLQDALPFILYFPGLFFYRAESTLTLSFSILSHIVIFFSVYLAFRKNNNAQYRHVLKLVAVTGAFIYWVTYIINIVLFTDPHMSIYNITLTYHPMLIGETLAIGVILSLFFIGRNIIINYKKIIVSTIILLFYGGYLTVLQTPPMLPERPSPKEIKSFISVVQELTEDNTISVLWYGNYSPTILEYYALELNLPPIKRYQGQYYNNIWSQYDYSDVNRERIKQELTEHFENSELIIIPEYMDSYSLQQPYAFYKFRDLIADYLNSSDSPRFVVRLVMYEYWPTVRLLVLQREDEANGKGVRLRLPYNTREQTESKVDPYASVLVEKS